MFHRAFKHKDYQILSLNNMQKGHTHFLAVSKYQGKWKMVLKYNYKSNQNILWVIKFFWKFIIQICHNSHLFVMLDIVYTLSIYIAPYIFGKFFTDNLCSLIYIYQLVVNIISWFFHQIVKESLNFSPKLGPIDNSNQGMCHSFFPAKNEK